MKRIIIIGSPGSGKSTLSIKLKEKLKLPLIHLDKIFWKPNWVMVDFETFDLELQKELIKDEWIIDGNYQRTLQLRLQYADTVIFLDYETEFCINSWKERITKNEVRVDMTADCKEFYDPKFEQYIRDFNKDKRPGIIEALKKYQGNVYTFYTRDEVNQFLETIKDKG